MRIFNIGQLIFWLLLSIASEFTGWVNMAGYISRLSEAALILSAFLAVLSDRAPRQVLQEIVKHTNVEQVDVDVEIKD